MRGVACTERNGSIYWYASIGGQKTYCGEGAKGREIAYAAKSKDTARRYETKEIKSGLKVKRSEFKTVRDICNW